MYRKKKFFKFEVELIARMKGNARGFFTKHYFLFACIFICNIFFVKFCKAGLEEPIFVIQKDSSLFGAAEISLEDSSNIRFLEFLSKEETRDFSENYEEVNFNYNFCINYSRLTNQNYRVIHPRINPGFNEIKCKLIKRKNNIEDNNIEDNNIDNEADNIRKRIVKSYDVDSVADVLSRLSKCYFSFVSDLLINICLNSHVRVTVNHIKKEKRDEYLTGVFGQPTKDLIIKNSTFIHLISRSGIGTSYVKQIYKNGNMCKKTNTYKHTHVYLSCNYMWEGIYNAYSIDGCAYVIFIYVNELCKLDAFKEINHNLNNVNKVPNVFLCSIGTNHNSENVGNVATENEESYFRNYSEKLNNDNLISKNNLLPAIFDPNSLNKRLISSFNIYDV